MAFNDFIFSSLLLAFWCHCVLASQGNWVGITTDSSGKFVVAANSVGVFTSSNYGMDWKLVLNCSYGGPYMSSSISGENVAIVSYSSNPRNTCGPIVVSNDFGNSWARPDIAKGKVLSGGAMDGTGQHQIAYSYDTSYSGNNNILVSADWGKSFTEVNLNDAHISDLFLSSIAMAKSNGKVILGASQTYSGPGGLIVSSDYGTTYEPGLALDYWHGLSCSSTCETVAASVNIGKQVSISTNSGLSWTLTSLPKGTNYLVHVTAAGQIIYAVATRDPLYISTDFGNTWTKSNGLQWKTVEVMDFTSDASGQYVYIADWNQGSIVRSTDFGLTWN